LGHDHKWEFVVLHSARAVDELEMARQPSWGLQSVERLAKADFSVHLAWSGQDVVDFKELGNLVEALHAFQIEKEGRTGELEGAISGDAWSRRYQQWESVPQGRERGDGTNVARW